MCQKQISQAIESPAQILTCCVSPTTPTVRCRAATLSFCRPRPNCIIPPAESRSRSSNLSATLERSAHQAQRNENISRGMIGSPFRSPISSFFVFACFAHSKSFLICFKSARWALSFYKQASVGWTPPKRTSIQTSRYLTLSSGLRFRNSIRINSISVSQSLHSSSISSSS